MRPLADNKELVLIVDDDTAMRLLLRAALEKDGFRVEECADGAQALIAFDHLHPDIVLLDLLMPGVDGFTACAQLRQKPRGERVPILVMTGLEEVEQLKRAYDVGATDVVTKPVQWSILGYRLRYMLRAAQAFDAVASSEASLAQAQEFARLGSWEWDVEGGHARWSDQVYDMLGLAPGEIAPVLDNYLALVHADDRELMRTTFTETLRSGVTQGIDLRVVRPDGVERVLHLQLQARQKSRGKTDYMHGTVQDVSERRREEERIRDLAFYDSLTGLPNRRLFKEQLTQAVALAKRHGRLLVTMFLDIDNFKRINDTLGHDAGDALLREVAHRLLDCLRGSDYVTRNRTPQLPGSVARLGGDEFTVMLTEINEPDDAARVARRVLRLLAEPFALSGQEVTVSASIGLAVFPEDAEDTEALLKAADIAMYHAKQHGKNSFEFFTQPMNVSAVRKLLLENELRDAIEHAQFELHYQPQVHAVTGDLVGIEALLRWHHPDRGLIAPGEFIAVAEQSGLILPINSWVLRTACEQNARWQQQGLPAVPIAINMSGYQFRREGLTDEVSNLLKETRLAARFLDLELTENILMRDLETALPILTELKALGVRISIDDFGLGYSSLSRIKLLPIDTLKIDRSFIGDLESDMNHRAITAAIIALARSLELEVIAEGVESAGQAELLRQMGCYRVQGFYYSEALPAAEFFRLYYREAATKAG